MKLRRLSTRDAGFDAELAALTRFEAAPTLTKEPLPVSYNPRIPIETFDVIITDEAHRSIYNLWRQVLEYFDAFLIGETLLLADDPAARLRELVGVGA